MTRIFLDIIHIKDTTVLTLKEEIFSILFHYNIDIQNIKDQVYDDTSNMYGKWNDLQALFIKDCLYVYYIHCLAHHYNWL